VHRIGSVLPGNVPDGRRFGLDVALLDGKAGAVFIEVFTLPTGRDLEIRVAPSGRAQVPAMLLFKLGSAGSTNSARGQFGGALFAGGTILEAGNHRLQ
jgi:hypothetical protein